MIFNKSICKKLIERGYTADDIKEMHPDFNEGCFKYVEAMAEGFSIKLGSRVEMELRFDSIRQDYAIVRPEINVIGLRWDIEKPEFGEMYFIIDMCMNRCYQPYKWGGDADDEWFFKRGLTTNEDTIKAIVKGLFGGVER